MSYEAKPWLKSYDPGVRPDIDPPAETLVAHIQDISRRFADKPALNFLGTLMDYRTLTDQTDRLAQALKARGLGRGDVVGVCLPNTPQYIITVLGALKAGCAVSGVSPLLTADEMAYQLNDCGAKALVIVDILFEKPFAKAAPQIPGLKTVFATGLLDYLPKIKQLLAKWIKKIPSGRVTPLNGKDVLDLKTTLASSPANPSGVEVGLDDTCFLQYTGGTTGVPKGAVLTHRNIVSGIIQYNEAYKMKEGSEIYCSALPFFHIAGLVLSLHSLYFGGTQVIIPDPRNVDLLLKQMIKNKPTVMANVPTLYLMLLQKPEIKQVDWNALQCCFSGAAPFSQDGIKAFEAVAGPGKLSELYGATETSPLIAMDTRNGRKKAGSVGLPIPGTRVRLVDAVTGEGDVPLGEEGELIVSGPQVMKEYHNKPEETAKTLKEHDGEVWLHTGDVARMDEDGYLFLVDRTKDMVIVGGYKVFSTEVENKLSDHPAIEMCAIVAAPNPDKPETEAVKLVVQKSAAWAARSDDETREDILKMAREKLAPYKVPKIVEFRDMPLTAVGKINKKELR